MMVIMMGAMDMTNVIQLIDFQRTGSNNMSGSVSEQNGEATILLFTGVRYENLADSDTSAPSAGPDSANGKRKKRSSGRRQR